MATPALRESEPKYFYMDRPRLTKRPPASPYPIGDMHPVLDNDGKVVGVTDDEATTVLARGFKKLTGEFLWVCRNTGIASTSYAVLHTSVAAAD